MSIGLAQGSRRGARVRALLLSGLSAGGLRLTLKTLIASRCWSRSQRNAAQRAF